MKQFVTGGVKSGKSNYAQELASLSKKPVVYIATATAMDDEMAERIYLHQQNRPKEWDLIEEPIHLAEIIETHAKPSCCLLIECLTLWLTNLLLAKDESLLREEIKLFLHAYAHIESEIILVANESNMGVTPINALARRYCDEAGLLYQKIAKSSDRVFFMIMGLPQILKG